MTEEPKSESVELLRFDSAAEAEQLRFIIASVGIDCAIERLDVSNGISKIVWRLLVPADRLEEARRIVDEERIAPIIPLRHRVHRPEKRTALYWLVGLVVTNLCIFIAMEGNGGSENHRTLLRFGASHAPEILAGQWWRTVSAVFLHIGGRHLLGNMVMLCVLGPTVLGQWGAGRFYFIYVLAGVGGNWISFLLSPSTAIKAGASGAILGLLGALAGYRLRGPQDLEEVSRFKTWHVVAMLVAFYGFAVGVGPSDHLAHIGGIFFGGLFAYFLPRPGDKPAQKDRRLSLITGAVALGLVVAAGILTVVFA